eukprot:9497319-Pyramimonas_sp.AAC.2
MADEKLPASFNAAGGAGRWEAAPKIRPNNLGHAGELQMRAARWEGGGPLRARCVCVCVWAAREELSTQSGRPA